MKIPDDIYQYWPLNRIHLDWAIMAGQDYKLDDPDFRNEVLAIARQMMRQAGNKFETIIERLSREGYRFVNHTGPITRPESNVPEWIDQYHDRGVHIPVILEAWLMEVGNINLMGSHPDWPRPGYIFEEDKATVDPLRTDAFVCEITSDYVDYLYEEWQSLAPEERPPFRIDFSPDHLHKANISGGMPYQVDTNRKTVDSLVLNERHCMSFLGYIRLALSWQGFPGFEDIDNAGEWSIFRGKII